MHTETMEWIAQKVVEAVKNGESLPENVAYELGRSPFVDVLRRVVDRDPGVTRTQILALLQDENWWMRNLGAKCVRPLVERGDEAIIKEIKGLWEREPHFLTKLSMLTVLLHEKLLNEDELSHVACSLEADRDGFLGSIHKYFGSHPRGTWGALVERLVDPNCVGERSIYLLALTLMTEGVEAQPDIDSLPAAVNEVAKSGNEVEKGLAVRLLQAIEVRKS